MAEQGASSNIRSNISLGSFLTRLPDSGSDDMNSTFVLISAVDGETHDDESQVYAFIFSNSCVLTNSFNRWIFLSDRSRAMTVPYRVEWTSAIDTYSSFHQGSQVKRFTTGRSTHI